MKQFQRGAFLLAAAFALVLAVGEAALATPKKSTLRLQSKSFVDGKNIPEKYTCNGQDFSPELNWSGAPSKTKCFALIMEDPDAPGKVFTHWILFNISPTTTNIHEEITPIVMKTGTNDYGETGYGGPNPPSGEHRYFFRLYALDTRLPLPRGASRSEVEGAMRRHVLEESVLMGRFAASAHSQA